MGEKTTPATPETNEPRTFQVPVRNAAPEEHEHQGKTFKIPIRGRQFSIPVHQASAPTAADYLSKIEENPPDPKTGQGEGTYAIKVNGQVKKVPFSKVPHVAAIAPMMAIGSTTFANEEDERRYLKDLDAAEEGVKHEAYNTKERWDLMAAQPTPAPTEPEKKVYEPQWWSTTKKVVSGAADVINPFSGGTMTSAPGMGEAFRGTEYDPQNMLQEQASKGDPQAQQILGLEKSYEKTFGTKLIDATGTKAFQSVFDPNSKSWTSRFTTSTVKALENQTSIENLYSLGLMYFGPESVARPVGLTYQAGIVTSSVSGVASATMSSIKGEGDSADAWGNLFGNALVLIGMHYGGKGAEALRDRARGKNFDPVAKDLYEKKFNDLTDEQKSNVLYKSLEDESPEFKKIIDQEVARLSRKRKDLKVTPSVIKAGLVAAENTPTSEELTQQRIKIAKDRVRQLLVDKARREVYKQEAARREAAARADVIPSAEEERGFSFVEGRLAENTPVTGLRKTTEREPGERYAPEPEEPAIPVTEGRSAAEKPLPADAVFGGAAEHLNERARVAAADRAVQELTEQSPLGQSFSSLPVDRQRVAADWLATNHPEQWEAFKGTPAYAQHESAVRNADLADAAMKRFLDLHPEGDGEALAPGADIYAGTAKLILKRSNIDSVLKADPETSKDLNEHTEKVLGKSFDSLTPEMRGPALSEYLRAKPDKVQAFMSVDLTERMQSGQHIDLANMAAENMARQRSSLRMDQRDAIRQEMDKGNADRILQEERARRQGAVAATVQDAQNLRTPSLDNVYRASQGLTELASGLGMGKADQFSDLFKIEQEALGVPEHLRTPAVREFLTKMRQVRAATEDHILQQIAEATAAKFRENTDGALDEASKRVVHLISQAADLQQAADDLRMQGQTAAADAAQQAADSNTREADAVVAGAESVHNPAPAPSPAFTGKITVGRETKVVSPGNPDGLPAHYAIVEATDAQTSHLPLSYEKREGFNQNGQPRDYSVNTAAQGAVESRASNIDTDQILSNGATTMEGPPVVDQRLHVISGNGRTLSLLTAVIRKTEQFGKYVQELRQRSASFGIDPSEVMKFKDPMLVKVLDQPVHSDIEWARLGTELNRDPTLGMSESEQGVAMARLLSPEFLDSLSSIVDSLPLVNDEGKAMTVREAMRARSADLAKLMREAGIISANKTAEYLTPEGDLTEKSKALFENMMAGLTVTDPAVLDRAPASIKDKLTRAGLYFIRMRNAGENWNVASYNTDAVRLFTRAQDAAARLSSLLPREEATAKGAGGAGLIEKYLYPGNYKDSKGFGPAGEMSFDGQPLVPPQHPAVEALARALDETPRTYATMIAKYANRAEGVQGSMFGAEHPADAFNAEIASKFNDGEGNPLHVIPEEWGSVVGLSEAVKAEIEDSRGPLPVEPEVHAETVVEDVSPDSSSVTDVIAEARPRSIRELQEAIAQHRNFAGQEMADHLTTLYEDILPKAINEKLGTILNNRGLTVRLGGKDADRPNAQGAFYVEDGQLILHLCDTANWSTWIHKMGHLIRKFMNPADQAVANAFVGAKPGEEWTPEQEEMFTRAYERYYFDGGLRRGKLEVVFAKISRAMQSIYNSVTGQKLAKGNADLNNVFDNWHDWTRAERKPITARVDVEALEAAASGKVEIPVAAKMIERGGKMISDKAQPFVFVDREAFREFLRDKRNKIKGYELHNVKGEATVYALIEAGKRKLYQMPMSDTIELARKARDLEAQLKKETDPRRQALLRGQLNGIEDKLRGSTHIFGATPPEPRDGSIIQLVHGMGEMPSMDHPTTPAEAVTAQQAYGDPTGIALGGEHGSGKRGTKADDTPGVREEGGTDRLPKQPGEADGEHGAGKGKGTPIAKPEKNPLASVKAAKVKAPERERGTPVVDPEKWREHVEALGFPEGTPPPTVRIDPDMREILSLYPGQAEAVEGVLSALQQYDATVLAAPLGSGKTVLNSVIANQLLGTSGDKVGLIVTRSQNLVHESDGYIEWGHHIGLTIDPLPTEMSEVQTGGVYAGTYAQIRGNKSAFEIPWDFVIFDESAEARNWTESDQGRAVVMLSHAAKKVVYSSATPYSTVMEMGYMHKLGLWPKGGFSEWAAQFGLREIAPGTFSGGSSAKKLTKLRQQLVERGQWQTLYKDMDGVSGHVALIPQTEEVRAGVRAIRAAFAKAAKAFQKAGMSRYLTPTLGHEAIYLKRFIAGSKLPEAIKLAKSLVDKGWSPILFTEYRSPAEEGMDFFHNLPGDMGAEINKTLPPLPNVVEILRKEFGDKIGIFSGEANQLRAGELEAFQSGEKDAIYMTYAAGAVGANAQDKIGDKPRAAVFIDLPWGGIMFEQGTGRPWRYGSKSNVSMFFLTSDALPEMKLLSNKILPRMRSLKAAVYGEKSESQLAKNLREAVGLPEELLEYDLGQEDKPQAAEWEQKGEGATFTPISDIEVPSAKDAMHKGMKYKGREHKLYQMPPEDLDPFERAAQAAMEDLQGQIRNLPAPTARAVSANAGIIGMEAEEAGRRAMGGSEPVKEAATRKARFISNDILLSDAAFLALHEGKGNLRSAGRFAQETGWMLATSGDKVVEKAFKRVGLPKLGEEMKRRIIDCDICKGLYQGRMQSVVRDIVNGNDLKPPEIELMSKIVEGKTTSDDPRINKAVKEFRQFTADVRKALADAGSVVVIYEDGIREEIPYSAIEEDPTYWPRMYDWNKKFVIRDKVTGERSATTLAEIMNMPNSDARRERIIDQFAEDRGISKLQARQFFEKHDRGIRLAGNVERARELNVPLYGRDRQAIERYIDQVATTLAVTEVHGQFRQKTDPIISQLPPYEAGVVDHVITSDLDPAHLPPADRVALSTASGVIITGKMLYSPLKVLTHLWKASMVTNTRSLVAGLFKGVLKPGELFERARDCNALLDYSKSAWMREYGMKRGNIGQKFLDFNGFTMEIQFSRILSSATGRFWFERYAYPELVKHPDNQPLRRKLMDLYGMSEDHINNIIKNGYGPDDVRRVELGAANWVTGSNRPSEMPPAFRPDKNASGVGFKLATLLRTTQMLHGFMFKTANMVNRTVFEELYKSNWKSIEPYHLIARFAFNAGLAGWALEQLLFQRHKLQGSSEAEIEKHRHEWLAAHPASAEALWWSMANMSMAIGVQPLSDLFNEMATKNPKDRQKLSTEHRPVKSAMGMPLGIPGQDAEAILTAAEDYNNTFSDTGKHKLSPAERRENILKRLLTEEVVGASLIPGTKAEKPITHHGRTHKAASAYQ